MDWPSGGMGARPETKAEQLGAPPSDLKQVYVCTVCTLYCYHYWCT